MSQAGTVWVDTRADTTGIARDIGAFASSALGTAALVGTAIGGIGVAAVKSSTEFNKALSGVAAVAGASAGQLDALRQAALDAGAATSFSASDAAAAEAELAKAGVTTADIMGGALSGSLDLAAAGQLGLADAATVTAQALNTFGLNGSDASHVADVLAAGANKSAADVSSLGQALAQGGLVAKQTGLSLEDTVGVLSLFADNALMGSDAGTSLKTMLQRLVPQSLEAKTAMEQLGLSFFDSAGNFVGIEETAQRLQNALGGLSTEQRQTALTTIFGADAIRASSLLYEAGAAGVRDYTSAVNDQGAASRMAKTQLDNLSGDLEQLRGSWETLLIGLGSSADSGLRSIVQGATDFVNELGNLATSPAFDALTENVAGVLGDVEGLLSGAAGEVLGFFNDLTESDLSSFFSEIGDAIDGLEGPLAGLALSLGSMAAAALPVVRALVPAFSPLVGIIAGVVLASEDGRSALGTFADAGLTAASILVPPLQLVGDALAWVADQGWLVQAAIAGFAAVKIVGLLTPIAAGAVAAGQAFTYLAGSISSIAATQGVSNLQALRGIIGASTGGGLTGALNGASLATAGFTAAIAGGLILYQNWAQDTKRVADETDNLTRALTDAGNVDTVNQLAEAFTNILDTRGDKEDGFAAAWGKTGLAISDVTSIINKSAGDFDKFRALWQDAGEGVTSFVQSGSLGRVPQAIRPFIENLFALVDAGVLTDHELRQVIDAITDLDKEAAGANTGLTQQAKRFKEEADGAKLSADAQRDLTAALADTSTIEERRDALERLKKAYPKIAEAAGLAAGTTSELDSAVSSSSSAFTSQEDAARAAAAAIGGEYTNAAKDAMGGVVDLMRAQDGLDDANQRVVDARQELQKILTGTTDGVISAREGLDDAVEALNKARANTGPGSKALKDASRDLREARQALRETMIDAGKQQEGDFIEDKRQDILDALDRVKEAQDKVNEINAGVSDEVTSAQDRVADAQKRLREELARTGPASREARDAQESLDDANLDVITSAQKFGDTLKGISADDIPGAVAQLKTLGEQGLLTKDQIDAMTGALWIFGGTWSSLFGGGTSSPVDSVTAGLNARTIFGTIGGRKYPQRPQGNMNLGRADGGPVWADAMHPVVERGQPELFTDRSGTTYLLPSSGGGQVDPLASGAGDVVGGIADLKAEVAALRGDLVSTVRYLARSVAPGAGEEMVPVLREIERNTRRAPAGSSASTLAAARMGEAEYVR